jgi:cytochrome c peroxidase
MKAHLRLAALLAMGLVAAIPPLVQAEDTAPAKPAGVKSLRLPEKSYNYANVELPAHFRTFAARRFDNTPAENPITDHGATLGRVLFYDTRLSANNTIACASCHHQKNGFTDPNRFSKGFEGKLTDRHAPSLAEVRYNLRGRFFWDERAATLEQLVLMPIQSKIELGQDLNRLNEILSKDKDYQQLFKNAFGDSQVTSDRIAKAVSQFLRSMVSYQSKYDEGMAKAQSLRDDFPNFTAQENRGKGLFVAQCASCHLPGGQTAHFVINRPQSNGLDADIKNKDAGVGDITLRPNQMGLFGPVQVPVAA